MFLKRTARNLAALALGLTTATTSMAEIEFVEVGGEPMEGLVEITNGPFNAAIHLGVPCDELPPGIAGPPCIAVYCGLFGQAPDGTADLLTAGEQVGTSRTFVPDALLAGHLLANPGADPNDYVWRPVFNEWHDSSGAPVRGFLAWGGNSQAGGDPHYGWIELTVQYDAATESHSAILHGYAFETVPNTPVAAGDKGCQCVDVDGDCDTDLSDLATVLSNFGCSSSTGACPGDTNLDGTVDLSDLADVLADFGCTG